MAPASRHSGEGGPAVRRGQQWDPRIRDRFGAFGVQEDQVGDADSRGDPQGDGTTHSDRLKPEAIDPPKTVEIRVEGTQVGIRPTELVDAQRCETPSRGHQRDVPNAPRLPQVVVMGGLGDHGHDEVRLPGRLFSVLFQLGLKLIGRPAKDLGHLPGPRLSIGGGLKRRRKARFQFRRLVEVGARGPLGHGFVVAIEALPSRSCANAARTAGQGEHEGNRETR